MPQSGTGSCVTGHVGQGQLSDGLRGSRGLGVVEFKNAN